MPYKNLREFVDLLEKKGELVHINTPVCTNLEITEIADRAMKSERGGKALLFENAVITGAGGHGATAPQNNAPSHREGAGSMGYKIPVLINAFGSRQRMSWALGVEDLDEIAKKIELILQTPAALSQNPSFLNKLGQLPQLIKLFESFPKLVPHSACQEVVLKGNEVDLTKLPVLKCWPGDGGPFITLPCVFTRDPKTGERNVGMYRMQIFDRNTTGMHWQRHKTGARHYDDHCGADVPTPPHTMAVSVALGGDPALTYAATAPLPEGIDEMIFAGWLRGKPVEMVKCVTNDLEVPADAEIILEGYVDPAEPPRREGPFGDHTGYYSLSDNYPVFHVTALTHCKNPIYPTTIVGIPPMEDAWLGKASERIFLPLIRLQLPEVVDINMPIEGVFHNMVIVSIKKRYPGQARKVACALWGLGQMMFAKMIVVVDSDVDVQNYRELLWRVGNNISPARDVFFTEGPIDSLDHSSPLPDYGSKMGIDATRKLPSEGFNREWPEVIAMNEEVKRKVDAMWKELGL